MKLSPLQKLLIVVAVQVLLLSSVIAFRQYTLWTRDSVSLIALSEAPLRPRDDGRIQVRYEISEIELDSVAGDDDVCCEVFVELQRGDDGHWHAVAIHQDQESSFDGTVLIKGDIVGGSFGARGTLEVQYGIEDVDIGGADPAAIPWDRATVTVEVLVDRFGDGEAGDVLVDGVPLDSP